MACTACERSAREECHEFVASCRGCCARAAARSAPFAEVRASGRLDRPYRALLAQFGLTHEEVKAASLADMLGRAKLLRKRADWSAGIPTIIVAPGPSLTAEDVQRVRELRAADLCRVISVSNAWKHCATWADAYFAADARYWREYLPAILDAGCEVARLFACTHSDRLPAVVQRLPSQQQPGLGRQQIHTGRNSGHSAINLAYLWGAPEIILLAFDMQIGAGGAKHFDGDHPPTLVQEMPFDVWLGFYPALAADLSAEGVRVVNCSRVSAIDVFERMPLGDRLAALQEPAL